MSGLPLYAVYSIMFLLASFCYILLGVYVWTLNPKQSLNRLFFACCLSLSIWAYAFSIANGATSYEISFFWHRVSVLGWGLLYSVLLHYFLVLTERGNLLKKPITYLLLYGPALVNVFIYGVYTPSAAVEFELVQRSAGWANQSANGFFDWFFYIYYISFSVASIILLWIWDFMRIDENKKRVAKLVSLSFAISVILGTITDVIPRLFVQDVKPQLGVIFAIIPITTIFFAVKKHGFMTKQSKKPMGITDGILTERMRLWFYNFLAVLFFAFSVLLLLEILLYRSELTVILFTSSAVFFVGLCVFMLLHSPISLPKQDFYLSVLMALTIPFVHFRYMSHGSSNIIWATPFLLMIVASVFNQRLMLLFVVVTSIASQLWIGFLNPLQEVLLTRVDYVARVLFFLISAAMVFLVSRLYQERLQENEEQMRLQRLISEVSAELVSVSVGNLDEKINWILRTSGMLFCVNRVYLIQNSENVATTSKIHEWCAEGLSSEKQQVNALICVPILNRDKMVGFLGCDPILSDKVWNNSLKKALQIIANVLSDALMKVRAEKSINFLAYYDGLTGLKNLALFKTHLDSSIAYARRNKALLGVLFLDLDGFKSVNDTMGHEAGDYVLKEVAQRLKSCVRRYDTVCRFGGDEFLVMFPQISPVNGGDSLAHIVQAGNKLMGAFVEPVVVNGQEFYITASAGIAVYPEDGDDSDMLIKNADLAMYASKDNGKNQLTVCSSQMKGAVKERLELTTDLYSALLKEELHLHYQPQVHLETGKIVGVEALIRWEHPQKGPVSPSVFIPLAEQTGLIHGIGEWVLATACRQTKTWQEKGYEPIVMAVNLSVEQFRTSYVADVLATVLKDTGLDPAYLELEITEGIAIDESESSIALLNALKQQGVTIAIDDFGTAYSSLSRLKGLPIDRIKMAMEFVQGIGQGSKDEAIAMVIIGLAKSLGLKVIAEGVENLGQMEFLRQGGCDEVQGYYFYRPMPASELEKLLIEGVG